jgi:O-acetyl-ADP-ribose deacetylase (regulator of RNase III)
MKLIHKKGDVFTSTAPAIGHGVNIYGRMGAGIAKSFRANYPDMYEDYKNLCDQKLLEAGGLMAWTDPATNVIIFNIASQDKPGAYAKIEWLSSGLNAALDHADKLGLDRVAIPHIGTGIGGLPLELVTSFVRGIAESHNADIEFWEYAE